jgi:hypothetical protein
MRENLVWQRKFNHLHVLVLCLWPTDKVLPIRTTCCRSFVVHAATVISAYVRSLGPLAHSHKDACISRTRKRLQLSNKTIIQSIREL